MPLYMPWPVNAGWSFVVCQVQCSMSGLVTWTKVNDALALPRMPQDVVQVVDAVEVEGGVRVARRALAARVHQVIVQRQVGHRCAPPRYSRRAGRRATVHSCSRAGRPRRSQMLTGRRIGESRASAMLARPPSAHSPDPPDRPSAGEGRQDDLAVKLQLDVRPNREQAERDRPARLRADGRAGRAGSPGSAYVGWSVGGSQVWSVTSSRPGASSTM